MVGPDALDLTGTAACQLGGAPDRQTAAAQRDDAFMRGRVGTAPSILACRLGQLNALALPFAPGLVVVAGHLQGQLEQQLLHRLQHDARHALGACRHFTEIDQSGNGQPCALGADRMDQLLGFGQRQAAQAVDLLGDDDLTGLQVADHAQQLGPVSPRARGLLAVDAGDVIARPPRILLNPFLALQILLVGADAQVQARDLDADAQRLMLGGRPHDPVGPFDQALASDTQRRQLGQRLAHLARLARHR